MKSSRLEKDKNKDNIINDVKDLLKLKKRNILQHNLRVGNSENNDYMEYECNSVRNKTLSVEKHPYKIRPYLEDIINNIKKSDM